MFKPGESGNPGGRPKMTNEEREAWQALATKCRIKLEVLADKEDLPPATLVKIAELSADRGWGKAIQAVDFSAQEGTKVEFSLVSPPTTTD